MHTNNDIDAPIIGHTHEHFRDAQRTNCKNSRPKRAAGLIHASTEGHARVRAWAPRVYPLHAPVDSVQTSRSHLDQPLQRSNAPKCSREDAWHITNQPKRPSQLRRTHLPSKEMHASSAHKARRMHLLAPKDARVPHAT